MSAVRKAGRPRADGPPFKQRRNKSKYNSTTLSLTDAEAARLDYLKEVMGLPMNRVMGQALSLLDQIIAAQLAGRQMQIEGQGAVMFFIPNVSPPAPR